jgi:hypothetical protein
MKLKNSHIINMESFIKEHQDKIKTIIKNYKECNECNDLKLKNRFKTFPFRDNWIYNHKTDKFTEVYTKKICNDCYQSKEKERFINFKQLLDNINEIQLIYEIMKDVKSYQKKYLKEANMKMCEICKDSRISREMCFCNNICEDCDKYLYSKEGCDPTCYKCSKDYHMKKVHCDKCKCPLW